MRRPLILHITGDYPDPVREPTTEAVKRLIDGLPMFDHVIVSLKRVVGPHHSYFQECPAVHGQRLFAYGYVGLPFGVGLYRAFKQVARRIEQMLAAEQLQPDLIHSHRLTFDGIAGWLLATQRQIPHFISVRGEVESKIFRFKPTYRPLMTRIVAHAARIFYVSAWYEPLLRAATGVEAGKGRPLPNIVANVTPVIKPQSPGTALVIAANLDIYRKKGLDRLIPAFGRVAAQMPNVALEIYGGGADDVLAEIRALIANARLDGRVTLHGKVPNATFLASLPQALALVMPSHNETFGMVYTEALFAGVPVLFSKATGIDGYLDGLDVGVGVNPNDENAIAAGLLRLVNDNAAFRRRIADASGTIFERLDPDRQIALYVDDVARALPEKSYPRLLPICLADDNGARRPRQTSGRRPFKTALRRLHTTLVPTQRRLATRATVICDPGLGRPCRVPMPSCGQNEVPGLTAYLLQGQIKRQAFHRLSLQVRLGLHQVERYVPWTPDNLTIPMKTPQTTGLDRKACARS
jgi:glycosyltransferase involved in cell wall biosynthesis